MKKVIVTAFVTVLAMACNSHNENEKTSARHDEHTEHATALSLNNGAKWKSDSATNANVALLKTIVAAAKKDKPGNYQPTAGYLQDGLNKMIVECKMKGPDYDALHKWLEPLMEKIKVLRYETNAGKAGEVFKEIEEHINLFSQYFE